MLIGTQPLIRSNPNFPQVVIYNRTARPQHAPYSQLTAEMLGNDHHHSRIPSPLVRRSQPEQARRFRHIYWILRKLTIQSILIDNNRHLDQCSHRN